VGGAGVSESGKCQLVYCVRHRKESVIKIAVRNKKQRCLWCARAEEKQRKVMRWCALWIEGEKW